MTPTDTLKILAQTPLVHQSTQSIIWQPDAHCRDTISYGSGTLEGIGGLEELLSQCLHYPVMNSRSQVATSMASQPLAAITVCDLTSLFVKLT